jgi:hypothetical protein
MKKLKKDQSINDHDSLNQLLLLKAICSQIYIARNISMNNDIVEEQLKRIDSLFRDKDNFN